MVGASSEPCRSLAAALLEPRLSWLESIDLFSSGRCKKFFLKIGQLTSANAPFFGSLIGAAGLLGQL